MNLPQARKDGLLTTELDNEVVVYDPERKQAHSLNRTAVAVWNHADGQISIGDLQERVSAEIGAPVGEAAIWLALRKLERAHLLAETVGRAGPMTRREMLRKAGKVGAATVAAPLVLSALVPTAAAAISISPCVATNGGIFLCGTQTVGGATEQCICVHTINPVGTACANLNVIGGACGAAPIGPACPAGQVCVTQGLNSNCFPTCTNTCTCPPI